MIGQTVSHYRILEKLGEGGMGIVYSAEDTKLNRIVALKFLPPELTRDADAKARFIQEARAASAIDHPNICTVHEIGETEDGRTFIVMARYEGEDLKRKVARGPLGIPEALDIGLQIAQGLRKAHERGIVHRDIKPANVFVTKDGLVKILDFGLAKLAGAKLTRTGSTLGTAQYMSPEQARGGEVDARTDLWSLGVVLYEMIAGRPPFRAEYDQALIYSILNDRPEPLSRPGPDVPAEVERLVARCLEKDPGERCRSAEEVITLIRGILKEPGAEDRGAPSAVAPSWNRRWRWMLWAVPAALVVAAASVLLVRSHERPMPAGRASVAVLPFVDMSPARDQGYFCDGMTEAIINRLSAIRELKVPARTSSFAFKGKEHEIRDIGRQLGVAILLEGSVQKSENRLRVQARLVNAADGYQLWSERYDREVKDVFAVQDEIASAIAGALKLKISPEERSGMSKTPIDNIAAYECYLKAYDGIWGFDESALDSSRAYVEKGISIVGDNALLYSAMALIYWQYVNIGAGQEDEITKTVEYAEKALALDPGFAMAHEVLASVNKDFFGNIGEAVRHYKLALASDPNELNSLRKLAYTYIVPIGRPSLAEPLVAHAEEIDPLEPFKYLMRGVRCLFEGDDGSAVEAFGEFYRAESGNPLAQFFYSWALLRSGRAEEGLSIIDASARATPDNVCTKLALLMKDGLSGDRVEAFGEMTPGFKKTCERDPEWSYYVALALSRLGARAEALDWLENAVNRGFLNYPALEREPLLDNVREEKRFKRLEERAKIEWESFKS